jgi:hypothetical protein
VVVFLNNENLMDKKVGRISLNTAFIPEDNIIVLEIPEISPDSLRKSSMFEGGFKMMIHFKSICECKNNIPISERCQTCRKKLDSEEQSW